MKKDENIPTLIITVPGKPGHKRRPRFARTKNGVRTYKDAKTVEEEELIKWYATKALGEVDNWDIDGEYRVLIVAHYEPPVSWTVSKRSEAVQGVLRHVARPDGDNIAKLAMDALNKLVWSDDSKVFDTRTVKRYAGSAKLTIVVQNLKGLKG